MAVDTCCGCIELKSGCFIIGYWRLISLIIGMPVGSANIDWNKINTSNEKEEIMYLYITLGILYVILFFSLMFTISFIVGLHKNIRKNIKAFLIYDVICNLSLIITIAWLSYLTSGAISCTLLLICLNIYHFIVIRSYYMKMGTTENRLHAHEPTRTGYNGAPVYGPAGADYNGAPVYGPAGTGYNGAPVYSPAGTGYNGTPVYGPQGTGYNWPSAPRFAHNAHA